MKKNNGWMLKIIESVSVKYEGTSSNLVWYAVLRTFFVVVI